LSLLGICEYASNSLNIYTDRNPFSKDGERLKATKEPHCTVVITQTTACAWPGYTFTYQNPSQFNLEFSQKGTDLYVKIAFISADGNLSLEVSERTGETLSECKFYKSVKPRSPFDAMHVKPHLFICRTTRIIHRTCHKKKLL